MIGVARAMMAFPVQFSIRKTRRGVRDFHLSQQRALTQV